MCATQVTMRDIAMDKPSNRECRRAAFTCQVFKTRRESGISVVGALLRWKPSIVNVGESLQVVTGSIARILYREEPGTLPIFFLLQNLVYASNLQASAKN
jgi:hypothetical protein